MDGSKDQETGAAFAVHGRNVQSYMRTSYFLNVYTVELYAILLDAGCCKTLKKKK